MFFLTLNTCGKTRHMHHYPLSLITPNPADLSRVMHRRLVREYVLFAAACLNSHNADKATLHLLWPMSAFDYLKSKEYPNPRTVLTISTFEASFSCLRNRPMWTSTVLLSTSNLLCQTRSKN